MNRKSRRDAFVLIAVMGGVATLARLAKPVPMVEGAGAAIDLDQMFPEQFDDWRVDEVVRPFVRPAQLQGKQYGVYDQVLERAFVGGGGERIMLSVAYGSEQSRPMQLHQPENCYRASGYQIEGTHRQVLTLAGRRVPVTILQAELPGRREPITYWSVMGGEPISDSASLRWRRLGYAARRLVPDGLLVRVSSINVEPAIAFDLHRRFADSMLRAMTPEHRAQVIGDTTSQ